MDIIIKNLSENNLKNINLLIPKNKLVVFTGVSGSGKSSVVFDTIASEAQRQLYEMYPFYIQYQLPQYKRPNVEQIQNLGAAIVVSQEAIGGNARSTVGTATEIYTLLRLLYIAIGKPKLEKSSELSFNSQEGMCLKCSGLGQVLEININKIIDSQKSWLEGCILDSRFSVGGKNWKNGCENGGFDIHKKYEQLSKDEKKSLLYGNEKWEGVYNYYDTLFLKRDISNMGKGIKEKAKKIIMKKPCPCCQGKRLNRRALECKISGYSISDLCEMEVIKLQSILSQFSIYDGTQQLIETLTNRLQQLINVGLDYVTLNRSVNTLSGGEAQRLKIVKLAGNALTDIMYIFDEPSSGMHPHDVKKICDLMQMLRDKGNSIIVVEHNKQIIEIADYIIELGPGAGKNGGNVIFKGSYDKLISSNTITAQSLKRKMTFKSIQRKPKKFYEIHNANINNLKNINTTIPLGVLVMVTGVAGSGKSSLFTQCFYEQLEKDGVLISQKSIVGMNKSNTATYMGLFGLIRQLFAEISNKDESVFSFNSKGACPVCAGKGYISSGLTMLNFALTKCEACGGSRYKEEVLRYTYKGKNIAEILKLSVDEALDLFDDNQIKEHLLRLKNVGLGYVTLGQTLDTFSGGEKQRLKLAKNLGKNGKVYIIDEPTSGLHMDDSWKLINVFNQIVEDGNTVIIIEHNLSLISYVDWVIDMGPGAGKNGGEVVYNGPADKFKDVETVTAKCFREVWN